MKPVKLTIILTCMIISISCTKKTEKKDPPPVVDTWTPYTVPPQPELKLIRMVNRMPQSNMPPFIRTTEFSYDDRNRLTMVRELENNEIIADYKYSGEELVKEIVHLDGINFLEYDSNITFSRNADTIVFKYHNDGNGGATYYTYLFNDSALVEYNESTQVNGSPIVVNKRFVYTYDRDGNVSRYSISQSGGPFTTFYTVLAVDDKRNVVRHLTPFAWLSSGLLNYNYSGMGVNNATRIQFANGEVWDIQYTYNNEGYPLTMTFPSGRTIELGYSR